MKKQMLLGAAMALCLAAGIPAVQAEDTSAAPALGAAHSVDAAGIVGQPIYDTMGAKIGEIDAVMVNADGAVQSVVVDVSGWLESEKLLNLSWSELGQGPDGQIVATKLTKEQAQLAEGYSYRGSGKPGQIITENGEAYEGLGSTQQTAAAPADTSTLWNGDGTVNTSNIIGAAVENGTGDKVGEINEVVIHPDGKIQGVVVDVGGLLGVGARSVLLDWKELEMVQRDGRDIVMVNANEDTLKALPEYTPTSAQ